MKNVIRATLLGLWLLATAPIAAQEDLVCLVLLRPERFTDVPPDGIIWRPASMAHWMVRVGDAEYCPYSTQRFLPW